MIFVSALRPQSLYADACNSISVAAMLCANDLEEINAGEKNTRLAAAQRSMCLVLSFLCGSCFPVARAYLCAALALDLALHAGRLCLVCLAPRKSNLIHWGITFATGLLSRINFCICPASSSHLWRHSSADLETYDRGDSHLSSCISHAPTISQAAQPHATARLFLNQVSQRKIGPLVPTPEHNNHQHLNASLPSCQSCNKGLGRMCAVTCDVLKHEPETSENDHSSSALLQGDAWR